MALLTTSVSSTHTYKGNLAEIDFFRGEKGELSVTIDTERVHVRSVQAHESDYANYGALFGDPEVMGKYATGQTKTKAEIKTRIQDSWVKRWNENDPYAGLAAFKKDTDEFLGHVVLGYGDAPGESEMAYLFARTFWGKGYGSEVVTSVVKEYAPATVAEKYTIEGKPLEKIVATSRTDNQASCRILEKVGMHIEKQEEKYGAMRNIFAIKISEVSK